MVRLRRPLPVKKFKSEGGVGGSAFSLDADISDTEKEYIEALENLPHDTPCADCEHKLKDHTQAHRYFLTGELIDGGCLVQVETEGKLDYCPCMTFKIPTNLKDEPSPEISGDRSSGEPRLVEDTQKLDMGRATLQELR